MKVQAATPGELVIELLRRPMPEDAIAAAMELAAILEVDEKLIQQLEEARHARDDGRP